MSLVTPILNVTEEKSTDILLPSVPPSERLTQLIPYTGGKHYFKRQMASVIHQWKEIQDVEQLYSPFMGAISFESFLLSINPNLELIINDINSPLVNFMRVLSDKNHSTVFVEEIEKIKNILLPYDVYMGHYRRALAKRYKKIKTVNVQDAIDFYVSSRYSSFPGAPYRHPFKYDVAKKREDRMWITEHMIEKMVKTSLFLSDANIIIENLDYKLFLQKYRKEITTDNKKDKSNTVLYLDPPYANANKQLYGEWSSSFYFADFNRVLYSIIDDCSTESDTLIMLSQSTCKETFVWYSDKMSVYLIPCNYPTRIWLLDERQENRVIHSEALFVYDSSSPAGVRTDGDSDKRRGWREIWETASRVMTQSSIAMSELEKKRGLVLL